MPLRSPIALLGAAVLAAGCGGTPSSAGDFEGEKAAVAQVVEDIEAASKRREADEICRSLITEPLAEQVGAGGRSCASELKKAIEDADVFDLDVVAVQVSGTSATARVKGTDEDDAGVVRTFELTKQGGSWRVSSFGA